MIPRCSSEFRKIDIKTPVPKSRFNKVADIQYENLLLKNSKFCIFCIVYPRATVSKLVKYALESYFFHQIIPVSYLKLFEINFSRLQ